MRTSVSNAGYGTRGEAQFDFLRVPASPRETVPRLRQLETLADALESFAGEISDSIEAARDKAVASALEIYYAAAELAKDPEHAHLIPIVEQMRESYRRDFGRDLPER